MELPESTYEPPFNITRASHLVLTVRDLAASRRFYVELVGLAVSDEDEDTIYLRGLEESCHHSLVLKRSEDEPVCLRLGFRVFTESSLERLAAHYRDLGCPADFVEAPYQGPTLHVRDPFGVPLEFCARMAMLPRLIGEFHLFKGGCAHRFDHFQVHTRDVKAACAVYLKQGFRISEYVVSSDGRTLTAAFLYRKGNPQDLVFFAGPGPRLHHFAFTVPDTFYVMRACDVAGNFGYGRDIERGPGRHGPGHAQFVYFRDPDGHRIELFAAHYQTIDIENEPVRWTPADIARAQWGLPAQSRWFEQATSFAGVEPQAPLFFEEPFTLEKCLSDADRNQERNVRWNRP